jgi:Tol biopolymer transport system component
LLCLGCGAPSEETDTEAAQAEAGRAFSFGLAERASVSSRFAQGNLESSRPALSRDGRVVGFVSSATNLVSGDTNGVEDIFVRDLTTDRTERVSVSSDGTQGDEFSDRFAPALDRTGRFVAFESSATNLVVGDTNAAFDVFLRDRRAGSTVRVSLGANGVQGDDFSISPALSADARFVAFASGATNLVPDDGNGFVDAFVRDRRLGTTSRVNVATGGAEANDDVISAPALSDDGRFVVFLSAATNLTPDESRGVFVRDRTRATTELVSTSSSGVPGNGFGGRVGVSADGRFVVFDSTSTNLVPNDTNELPDVFVRDLRRRTTERVSVSSSGEQGNGSAGFAAISADGRFIAFGSAATNLVPGISTPTGRTYVHDRVTGFTRLATRTFDGNPPDGSTGSPALSGDGSLLATESAASNLVPNDTNGATDVFVQRLLVPPGGRSRR